MKATGPASVHLVTVPAGAKVFVDGTESGVSPLDLTLAEGEYLVSAALARYRVTSAVLSVIAGQKIDSVIELKPIALAVPASPGDGAASAPEIVEADPTEKTPAAVAKPHKGAAIKDASAPKKPVKKPSVQSPAVGPADSKPESTPGH